MDMLFVQLAFGIKTFQYCHKFLCLVTIFDLKRIFKSVFSLKARTVCSNLTSPAPRRRTVGIFSSNSLRNRDASSSHKTYSCQDKRCQIVIRSVRVNCSLCVSQCCYLTWVWTTLLNRSSAEEKRRFNNCNALQDRPLYSYCARSNSISAKSSSFRFLELEISGLQPGRM